MSKKQVLRPDHIIPQFGPHFELSADSDPFVMCGANGLLRLDLPFQLAPLVTDVFLGQYVDKPLHELFKELRDKTYRQEMAFLTKSWKDWKKQHKQDAAKGLPMWQIVFLSMCTQCALENCGYHPFLEQEAKQWLRGKFQLQSLGAYFNDRRWDDLRDAYEKWVGWSGPFYYRNDNRITVNWL